VSGSGICWAICKSAPCSRQITTPAPHHSVFYRPDALTAAQPTVWKHWMQLKHAAIFYSKNHTRVTAASLLPSRITRRTSQSIYRATSASWHGCKPNYHRRTGSQDLTNPPPLHQADYLKASELQSQPQSFPLLSTTACINTSKNTRLHKNRRTDKSLDWKNNNTQCKVCSQHMNWSSQYMLSNGSVHSTQTDWASTILVSLCFALLTRQAALLQTLRVAWLDQCILQLADLSADSPMLLLPTTTKTCF